MHYWKRAALVDGAFVVCSNTAFAQFNKCEDAAGKISYTDQQCDGRKGTKVKEMAASSCNAKSADELKTKFEQAFKAKNQTDFLSLFSWQGVDAELQTRLKSEFSSMLSKEFIRSELKDASLSVKDAEVLEGRGLRLNLVPVKTLYFERSVGSKVVDPREKTSGQFSVGQQGACFVIGTYTKK